MPTTSKVVRTFRTASLVVYVVNIITAIMFIVSRAGYLEVLIGILTSGMCLSMIMVTMNKPMLIVSKFENMRLGEYLFTFWGRCMMDIFIALYLYAMGPVGVFMATLTICLVIGIRIVGIRHPDAFTSLFRQPIDADDDTLFTYEQDLSTVDQDTLESGRGRR
uniref:Uncharacterized protein n=1 Tax=Attheya septentrionalis TaxID=420275 RepID=A0A7S2XNM9_9STRA|mmetsp:Transcript_2385/g.4331  ORF Transcript_2385/g.4331 Transcript_2385/m.4331 type:complete len:163 (+) Transcript_2385:268-756(+)